MSSGIVLQKVSTFFFEKNVSVLAHRLHFATVLSRRDPHFAGGALEVQHHHTKSSEGTIVSFNARALARIMFAFFAHMLHFATVLSRRDPHFAGGALEVQHHHTKSSEGTFVQCEGVSPHYVSVLARIFRKFRILLSY